MMPSSSGNFGLGSPHLDGGIHPRLDRITPFRRSFVVVGMRRRPDRRGPAKSTAGNICQLEEDDKPSVLNGDTLHDQ
jgi:hypothetical protein